ncbi:putative enzyme related to lactoylglutathione lyase [Tamaricihabitans halophyticus]|uniref:Putative enzyme related to lactoylglutathione lyase n=1 Tax=Tamaricihabitans halophyticus TaxID=1262583 RepID=A0A4R2QQN6_9PSEU|nr:VOC family protein [Tamaricihabitans halophyticus]TCP51917.1 putative enzyme related to lactoylglutathione lyase [Tamaricihabitans halophyticus]
MIRGVHMVVLTVDDQDRALAFWTEKVGFSVATDASYGEGNRWLEVRSPDERMTIVLSKRAPGQPDTRDQVPTELPTANFFMYADDPERTCQELAANGVSFPTPLSKQPWGWWALFEDSEGTRIAISQPAD